MADPATTERGAPRSAATPGPEPRARLARRALVGVGVLLLLAAAAGVALHVRKSQRFTDLGRVTRPGAAAGFNVILVTLDTVRADHLGSYGDKRAQTPNLDSLVQNGVQFDDAITPVPITLPSHTSMMTGLYPPHHGVRDNGIFRLGTGHATLAERMKERGYATAAFIGCFVLDQRFGLARGFDTYDFDVEQGGFFPSNFDFNQRSAAGVTEAALRWLDQRQGAGAASPFFLWVHYFDAHVPYQSPLAQEATFADRPYDAEIAYVDLQFGRLLAELDRQNLRQRTLIVVVSDHGEGLKEHGESTHGLFVYESTLHVAFILSSPGLFRGEHHVNDRVVSLVDLRPTIEDLVGLAPDGAVDGVSLLRAAPDPNRSLYVETKMPYYAARCSPLYGIRRRHEKYVEAPVPEYYDLAADPAEQHNAYAARRERREALARELEAFRKSWSAEAAAPEREMTADEAERLRSLGYAHAAGGAEPESLPDPKAMMSASAKITTALRLQRDKHLEEALQTAREAADECKGYFDAVALVAQLCQQLGRTDQAIQALKDQLELSPTAAAALQLAQTYLMAGRYDDMESALSTAARLEPDNGFVHVLRADRLSTEGRVREAIAEYEQALRLDPYRTGILVRPVLNKLKAKLATAPESSDRP